MSIFSLIHSSSPPIHLISSHLISFFYKFHLLCPPQVDRQSQFIQGYRVLFRQMSGLTSPGSWQSLDVKIPSERSMVLSALKKGIVYEIKVRPYFNEFQGMDSESRTARTTEEGTQFGSFEELQEICDDVCDISWFWCVTGMNLLMVFLFLGCNFGLVIHNSPLGQCHYKYGVCSMYLAFHGITAFSLSLSLTGIIRKMLLFWHGHWPFLCCGYHRMLNKHVFANLFLLLVTANKISKHISCPFKINQRTYST